MKRTIFVVAVILSFLITPLYAFEFKTGSDKFATVLYPATACDINLEEGTIETWARVDFDPAFNLLTPEKTFYMQMTYFNVGVYGKNLILHLISRCSYDPRTQSTRPSLYLYGDLIGVPINIFNETLKWEKGQWHYLAVTWKNIDKKVRYQLFIDGILMEQKEAEPKREIFLEEGSFIELGSHYYNCSYGAIDSFRISSVVRTKDEISDTFAAKTLDWDRFTFLLDNFINVDKVEKITVTKELKKGKVNGSFELIEDHPFYGIKLHVVEE